MTIHQHRGVRVVVPFLALIAALAVTLVSSSSADAAQPHTRLVIKVTGCNSCKVRLVRAISGSSIYWRSQAEKVGSDGKVVFNVLTKRTKGMSFELQAPWEGATDSVPNVVTRYAKQAPGETWTAKQAKHSARAFGCWAGTTKRRTTLHFRVARITFDGSGMGGTTHDKAAVAWASPGLHSWKPKMQTWHGRLGNQDAFYCTRP